jgi:serine/threonine protein kinase
MSVNMKVTVPVGSWGTTAILHGSPVLVLVTRRSRGGMLCPDAQAGELDEMQKDSPVEGEIAGYRLESVLGRGGMGVVYRAVDTRLQRRVALKVLPPEMAGDPDFQRRLVRESRMAAAIEHPNIVPIYEAREADGSFYIAMRYVRGRDLRTLIDESGPLDAERALDILEQIADALDAAHARGLIHRDVKPENILVSTDEGRTGARAYLTDFGLTRSASTPSDITQGGQVVGSSHYMAPEQSSRRPAGRQDGTFAGSPSG